MGKSISTHALCIAHKYVSGKWLRIPNGRPKQNYPYIGFIYFNVRCTMFFLINDSKHYLRDLYLIQNGIFVSNFVHNIH